MSVTSLVPCILWSHSKSKCSNGAHIYGHWVTDTPYLKTFHLHHSMKDSSLAEGGVCFPLAYSLLLGTSLWLAPVSQHRKWPLRVQYLSLTSLFCCWMPIFAIVPKTTQGKKLSLTELIKRWELSMYDLIWSAQPHYKQGPISLYFI